MEIIKTESLYKSYGNFTALHDISLNVFRGEIYGFLGLNGAGKTTLIRILLGMIKADSGKVKLFDKELTRNFDQWNDIGYLVETPHAYPNLSVEENLKVHYKLRQLRDPKLIDQIIEELKLSQYRKRKSKHLSLGNQQRLGLAKAMMHRPKLLILDEPINGLDPEGIVEIRELLKQMAAQGTTVFLSSHILGEISKVAQRIGIIHNGKLIKELTTVQLQEELIRKLVINTANNPLALEKLSNGRFQPQLNEHNEIEILNKEAIEHPEEIARSLVQLDIPPKKLNVFTEDLEMYFLRNIKNQQ